MIILYIALGVLLLMFMLAFTYELGYGHGKTKVYDCVVSVKERRIQDLEVQCSKLDRGKTGYFRVLKDIANSENLDDQLMANTALRAIGDL